MKVGKTLTISFLSIGFYLLLVSLLDPLAYHFYANEKIKLHIIFQSDVGDGISLIANKNKEESQKTEYRGGSGYQTMTFSIPNEVFSDIQLKFDKETEEQVIRIKKIEFQKFSSVFSIKSDNIQDYFNSCFPARLVGRKIENDGFQVGTCIQSNKQLLSGFDFVQSTTFSGSPYVQIVSFLLSLCFFAGCFFSGKEFNIGLEKIFIALFLLMLLLPTIDENFDLDDTLVNEKRIYATKPDFSIEGIDKYARAYNDYYNDQFGFRNWFLDKSAKLKYSLFSESTSNKVIGGKNGWWFFNEEVLQNGEEYIFSDYTHRNLLNQDELLGVKESLERRKKNMDKMGIGYYIAYFPNKHSIYEEYLPTRAKLSIVGNLSRMDQITSFLEETNSSVQFVDIKSDLLTQKNTNLLYLKNDTHWNEYGAFVAYQKLFNAISKDFPTIKPKLNYDIKWISDIDQYEEVEQWCTNCYSYFKLKEIEKIYARDGLDKLMGMGTAKVNILDKVPVFRFDNKVVYNVVHKGEGRKEEQYIVYENPYASSNKTLLVFRDSYTRAIGKFYIPHFKKVIFIWGKFKLDVIKKEQPDIVLDTHVERYIYDRIK